MVPDPSLSIRERAIASWPPAWHGQNLRDILVTLGYDVDKPWRELPKKDRDWILYTDETPTVPVYAGFTPKETRAALRGNLDCVVHGGECALPEGLEFEAAQFGFVFATEDMREGTGAFLERRPAEFKGC